ncbi:MAG: acetoacetate--CoA ligase [Pseudomonadota bacterium]|nr:acetoacetate--CoA ligase [Pseudomonadota bacterium]
MVVDKPLWQPSPEQIASANIAAFTGVVNERWGLGLSGYEELYHWSISQPERFWESMWSFGGILAEDQGARTVENREKMPGAKWFPDARLNFAENLLKHPDDSEAIVFYGEDKVVRRLTRRQLRDEVARLSRALRAAGLVAGDRVAGFVPNTPEAVIAMLAATSIGVIWSSCSPDFGVQGVLDRFGQIEPKVLFAADGYWYNGKPFSSLDKLAEIGNVLPSLEKTVVFSYLDADSDLSALPGAVHWRDFIAAHPADAIEFTQLPFNHPLYIMYSSGTTGAPKCIVHGAGGTLIQHLKEHLLHTDIKPGDRLFYFTTCGWMMWNWLVSGLASGATLLLYDGSPFARKGALLWQIAEQERMTVFGTSAKYIDALSKAGIRPREGRDLSNLRAVLSTGSPLAPEGFDFVYREIKQDLCLSSISGGTDIISCFALGNPVLPVWRGELQCLGLGLQVEVLDDDGKPLPPGEKGELACAASFPSMPVAFWNDPDGKKYHAAYFEKFPDLWCHGDYVELTRHGGIIISGRSDAVLNPGGVRIGTAEIYRQAEQVEEVVESLVIGQRWEGDVRVVLFVRLQEGLALDDALRQKIRQRIRSNTTPRHVPEKIIQVDDIPRTKSGKIVELAVRKVVHGEEVKNREALANPEALDEYRNLPALQV